MRFCRKLIFSSSLSIKVCKSILIFFPWVESFEEILINLKVCMSKTYHQITANRNQNANKSPATNFLSKKHHKPIPRLGNRENMIITFLFTVYASLLVYYSSIYQKIRLLYLTSRYLCVYDELWLQNVQLKKYQKNQKVSSDQFHCVFVQQP